jgi:hypothetical protein
MTAGMGVLWEVVVAERGQSADAATLPLRVVVNVSPIAMMRLCVVVSTAGEILAYSFGSPVWETVL